MFEIKLTTTKISDGSTAISWCVDHETLKELAAKNITDPQVVIMVAPQGLNYHYDKEYRKVVPLKDLLTYIEFHTAGENKIFAFISTREKRNARTVYLSYSDGHWSTSLLTNDGSETLHETPEFEAEPIFVNVPAGCFAKSPPKWEQAWVNWLFKAKPMDQCNYRRRRMLAYTLQIPLMMLNMIVRLFFTIVSLSYGACNFSFNFLLHPFRYDLDDVGSIHGGGSWFFTFPEDEHPETFTQIVWFLIRGLYRFPLMPIIFIPVVLLLAFGKAHILLVFVYAASILFLLVLIVFCIATGTFTELYRKLIDYLEKTDELWYLDQEEIDLLVCSSQKDHLTFDQLPARKKTLKLRYLDLKSKVCKPFSR